MSENWSEKTQAPTPYRRAEARREGKVARSAELTAAVMSVAALLLMKQAGPAVVTQLKLLLGDALSAAPTISPLARTALIGQALLPIAAGLLLIALAINLAQTGF